MKYRFAARALLLVLCLLLPGCDSDRLSQFSAFAAAGSAYVATLPTLTAAVGSTQITLDSAVQMRLRPDYAVISGDPEGLKSRLAREDAALQDYLATLDKLNAHAALLGAYFATLAQLTSNKSGDDTAKSADGLIDAINTFNPQIEKSNFMGKNVDDFLNVGTNLVVAHFEVKALDRNLDKAAPVINQALALQQAAVMALSAQLKDAVTETMKLRESTDILDPYVANAPLPKTWAADRESFLRSTLTLHSADAAKDAITKLRAAFKDLVENKQAKIDSKTLIETIGQMAGYTNAVKASTASATK